MEYDKGWLSISEQLEKLIGRGLEVPNRVTAAELLRTVGYYRLTGYLYPFRNSVDVEVSPGVHRVRVLDDYREGTSIEHARLLLDFDRELRMLVLEAVERIEIALRTQLAHSVGKSGPFAHETKAIFVEKFTEVRIDAKSGEEIPSKLTEWRERVANRVQSSDEAFVQHFRTKYDGEMPIWALAEVLELGQIARLYDGLRNDIATEIAAAFNVSSKKLMNSWVQSINYVRNISAHHARLFNRKLVAAPKRPNRSQVSLLAHLSDPNPPKQFGMYNVLAIMAYLLRSIDPKGSWSARVAEHLRAFPSVPNLTIEAMGLRSEWLETELWA